MGDKMIEKKFRIRAENVNDGRVVDKVVKIPSIQAAHKALANHGFVVTQYHEIVVGNKVKKNGV